MGKTSKLKEELEEGRWYVQNLVEDGLETPERFAEFCKSQDALLARHMEDQRFGMQEYRKSHLDRARELTREATLRWREKNWMLTKAQRTARYEQAKFILRGADESAFRAWLQEMRAIRSDEWIQHLPLYGIGRFEADMSRAESRAWDYYRDHQEARPRLLAEYFDPTPGNELLTKSQWLKICLRSHGHCFYCGRGSSSSVTRLQKDHRIPLSKGGRHCALNIVPACRTCNIKKMTQSFEAFVERSIQDLL